jgi:hypothetical protein
MYIKCIVGVKLLSWKYRFFFFLGLDLNILSNYTEIIIYFHQCDFQDFYSAYGSQTELNFKTSVS